jgi:hypothetical protein
LQPNDAAIHHVEGNYAFNGLIGVNQREGDLVTAADDAMAHALFLAHLLDAEGCATTGINRSRLLMSGAFSDHWKALLISAKVYTPAF